MSPEFDSPYSRPVPADEPISLALRGYPPEVLDWSDLETDLADAISDSMDMDWTSRDGARAVVEYLKKLGAHAT